MEIDEEYPLHFCAFHGSPEFEMLIRNADLNQINKRDPYGNTPLHIAAMLRDEKIVKFLLAKNCALDIRNSLGWRPIDELVATGSELLVRQGYLLFREQLSNNGQSSLISQNLLKIPDFILDFRWEFRTWVPFLARHLPSDNCRLFKKANLIRLDTTLLDFKNRSWVRGQLSIIVDGNKPFESRTCLIDHEHRSYQILDGTMARENSDEWLNETVQTSLHMPLIRMHMDFTRLSCKKETSKLPWLKDNVPEKFKRHTCVTEGLSPVSGATNKRNICWAMFCRECKFGLTGTHATYKLFLRCNTYLDLFKVVLAPLQHFLRALHHKSIGPYNTQNYSINHVKISVKKRSEHLTKEDVRFLSTLHSHIKQGTVNSAVKLVQDRASAVNEETADGVKLPRLTPRVTWRTYRSWKLQDNDLYIGRKPVLKLQTNEMKLNVAMTNEIDFNITYLLDMFKCFSPLRKFTKLDETILSSLPPGFPVRIDVPVSPGITGRVTFKSVELCEGDKMTNSGFVLRDELFKIPMGYISSDVL